MGIDTENPYFDRKSQLTPEKYQQALSTSTTLYVGGLSAFTFETYLVNFFSLASPAQSLTRLIMGINRKTNKPCGFCFVEFATREAAEKVFALHEHVI